MRQSIKLSLLLLCIFAAGGYALSHPFAAGRDTASVSPKVGVLLPLSGALAEFGVAAKNGFLLAQGEYPERFKSLDFVFEDSEYDAKVSISAFRRLAADEQTALIYNWGTATGEAIAPIAESQGMPLITNSQTPGISEGRAKVLRFINPAEDFSKAILMTLRSRGYRRLGIIKTELAYINELLDGIHRNLQAGESIEIVDTYEPSNQDFKSSIAKLGTKQFDALGVLLISGQIGQFYRQATVQGVAIPTFGSDFFESETEITRAGPGIEGAIYANIIVNNEFREKYRQKYGDDTHLTYASNAYDFALLTAKLFDKVLPDVKRVDFLAPYQNVTAVNGTSGAYSFTKTDAGDNYFSFSVGVKEIREGRIRVLSLLK